MTLNILEPAKVGFWANFLHFLATAHISRVNCDKMAEDRPREPAKEIFSIKPKFV